MHILAEVDPPLAGAAKPVTSNEKCPRAMLGRNLRPIALSMRLRTFVIFVMLKRGATLLLHLQLDDFASAE
jgi:hypothetical protein